jgi:CheY-like chemotaxis protein
VESWKTKQGIHSSLAGDWIMAESVHILILEDSPNDVELIKFELQEAGLSYTARVATTEADYVRELLEGTTDLIISDYDLPKYNGALALAEARRRCPDTPFILVTGAVTEDRAIEILTQGAKDYVLKSRLEQRLAPAVKRALAEAEDHRARKQAEADLRKAYRALQEQEKIRTAERKAEIEAREKMEEALREGEARESAYKTELRQRAQQYMKMIDSPLCPSEPGVDSQKLLHELQVYQIELEMQNEELMQCKEMADALREKHLDIFDFAPICYLTLNPEGNILRANLTAAGFLGAERFPLTGQRFQLHLSRESYPAFDAFFRKTFESGTLESCDVMLLNGERPWHVVRLQARSSDDRKECHLVMMDITDLVRPEEKGEEHAH